MFAFTIELPSHQKRCSDNFDNNFTYNVKIQGITLFRYLNYCTFVYIIYVNIFSLFVVE